MKRFSNSSARQSLGMPSRSVGIDSKEGKGIKQPMASSRPSTGNPRRKTITKSVASTQFGKRQPQNGAMGASRPSTTR